MRILSGIKPTGELTLGNYLGAIKHFVSLQNQYSDAEFLIFIADLHALTTKIDKTEIKNNKRKIALTYLACGLDPNKTILFNQSEISEHSELAYIMESISYMSELERMTQSKDKKNKDNIKQILDYIQSKIVKIEDSLTKFNIPKDYANVLKMAKLTSIVSLLECINRYFNETISLNNQETKTHLQTLVMEIKKNTYSLTTITNFDNLFGLINEQIISLKEKLVQLSNRFPGTQIKTSFFTYPALMAADILLYDATLVPVGEDQKQHLELCKNLAKRFNSSFGNTFTIPEVYIPKTGKRIMGLQNPLKKMSKSEGSNNKDYISLFDNPLEAKNKIKIAITDSDTMIYFDQKNKAGISNLLTIYSALTDISIKDLEFKYKSANYAIFKSDLGEIVFNFLVDFQSKYNTISNSGVLDNILDAGQSKAKLLASRKIKEVYKKIGLLR